MRANEDVRDEASRPEQTWWISGRLEMTCRGICSRCGDVAGNEGDASGRRTGRPGGDRGRCSLDEERAKADAELGEELDALEVDDADGGEEPASETDPAMWWTRLPGSGWKS